MFDEKAEALLRRAASAASDPTSAGEKFFALELGLAWPA
jgi:hypothetical protein